MIIILINIKLEIANNVFKPIIKLNNMNENSFEIVQQLNKIR